nr:hypothetical protein [Tanacetum cinerariifolium]
IRRWRYNLTLAESKFKTPMLDHQDKYMMKAQHKFKGRLLASFQDREHKGGETRSQGGLKDNDSKIKIQDHSMQIISQMNSQEQGSKSKESSGKSLIVAKLLSSVDINSGNIYTNTFEKHLEEKHMTWARFRKKLDKDTTLGLSVRGDGVKICCDAVRSEERRRHYDLRCHHDNLLKKPLEDLAGRRRQETLATPVWAAATGTMVGNLNDENFGFDNMG